MQHDTATTSFLDRPHGRLAYDVTGQGPLVIASTGLGDGRQSFRFLVADVAGAGYRIATMDLRGHGQSSTGWPTYDETAIADDLPPHRTARRRITSRAGLPHRCAAHHRSSSLTPRAGPSPQPWSSPARATRRLRNRAGRGTNASGVV
jgi:pimeloyl-ACP methyl ester carboxylesterase